MEVFTIGLVKCRVNSLLRPNVTVHRAAANDINFIKPRDPRLRVQRFC